MPGGAAGISARAPAANAPPAAVSTGKDIPGVELKYPELALCTALQFGERPEEVVYFVFGAKKKPDDRAKDGPDRPVYDVMYVYTPGLPAFKQPKLFRSQLQRVTSPAGYVSENCVFPPIKLFTKMGGAPVEVEISMLYRVGARRLGGTMLAVLAKDHARAKVMCDLGRVSRESLEAPIKPMVLFEKPTLAIRVMDNGKTIIAQLQMGEDRKLMSLGGEFGDIFLEVQDENKKTVEKKKISPDKKAFADDKDAYEAHTGRLTPGKSYTFKLSCDLGPMGALHAEQSMSIEKKTQRL